MSRNPPTDREPPAPARAAAEHIRSTVSDSIEAKRRFFEEHAGEVERAARAVAEAFRAGGKLLVCGNGGSAADAQHLAGEFVNQFLLKERPALPALALTTDGGVLTCIANDTGFERVFARQVEAFGARGDVLLVISTSGNSPNVLAAADAARARADGRRAARPRRRPRPRLLRHRPRRPEPRHPAHTGDAQPRRPHPLRPRRAHAVSRRALNRIKT